MYLDNKNEAIIKIVARDKLNVTCEQSDNTESDVLEDQIWIRNEKMA